jgi:hypothetical protein
VGVGVALGLASLLGPARAAEPVVATSELNVRDTDEQGRIFLDEREVGSGTFSGRVAAGVHRIKVTREGYQSVEKVVDLAPGQVHMETVLLRRMIGAEEAAAALPLDQRARIQDGLYGGIQFLAAFEPGGSGTTLDEACDTTGATSCDPGSVLGGGLSGYVGWYFDPLGLELALLGGGDVVQPVASFDGTTGSEINPVLASPARQEKFTIGRVGGGAALRARFAYAVSRVRFTAAIGPGIVYRAVVMERRTTSPEGYVGEYADSGARYVSPMLSLELAAHVLIGASTALAVGVSSWFEQAGDDTKSDARNDMVLANGPAGTLPLRQATPAYDLANGNQWFVGPFLGLSFGL